MLHVDAHIAAFNLLGIIKVHRPVSGVRGLEPGIRGAIDLGQLLEGLGV